MNEHLERYIYICMILERYKYICMILVLDIYMALKFNGVKEKLK